MSPPTSNGASRLSVSPQSVRQVVIDRDRGARTVAGRAGRATGRLASDGSGGANAEQFASHLAIGRNSTGRVQTQAVLQHGGVRLQADIGKDRGDLQFGDGAVMGLARAQARYLGLAQYLGYAGVEADVDFPMRGHALAVTGLAGQDVPAMEDDDPRGELGGRQRPL